MAIRYDGPVDLLAGDQVVQSDVTCHLELHVPRGSAGAASWDGSLGPEPFSVDWGGVDRIRMPDGQVGDVILNYTVSRDEGGATISGLIMGSGLRPF